MIKTLAQLQTQTHPTAKNKLLKRVPSTSRGRSQRWHFSFSSSQITSSSPAVSAELQASSFYPSPTHIISSLVLLSSSPTELFLLHDSRKHLLFSSFSLGNFHKHLTFCHLALSYCAFMETEQINLAFFSSLNLYYFAPTVEISNFLDLVLFSARWVGLPIHRSFAAEVQPAKK